MDCTTAFNWSAQPATAALITFLQFHLLELKLTISGSRMPKMLRTLKVIDVFGLPSHPLALLSLADSVGKVGWGELINEGQDGRTVVS